MPATVYLITGANRGIGLGLVKEYARRPNNIVIATVRDITKTAAISSIVPATDSKIIIVNIDSLSDTDPATAVAELQSKHGISKIDVVIANAGIANHWGPGISTPAKQAEDHFKVNAVGTLTLFQATISLLEKSAAPKFVAISTGLASIGDMALYPLPDIAYGASKAALNFITRKLHFEHPTIVIYSISPGWVQTDMGTPSAQAIGMEDAPTTLAECITGVTEPELFSRSGPKSLEANVS